MKDTLKRQYTIKTAEDAEGAETAGTQLYCDVACTRAELHGSHAERRQNSAPTVAFYAYAALPGGFDSVVVGHDAPSSATPGGRTVCGTSIERT